MSAHITSSKYTKPHTDLEQMLVEIGAVDKNDMRIKKRDDEESRYENNNHDDDDDDDDWD